MARAHAAHRARPTRAGWAVLALGAAGLVGGWLIGQPELAVLGVAALAATAVAVVAVRTVPVHLEVHRAAVPPRVQVDEACRIHLRARNTGRSRTPVLTLLDEVDRYGRAQLRLAPLPAGATRDALHAFPTSHRGLFAVGPLRLVVEDPFGLARSTVRHPGTDTVIVLPRIWDLTPLPPAPGEEPEQGVRALASNSTVDEEFAALRAYEPGDDIRRIHWRTTARTGSPMVRQFDQPWQHRTTVLLDLRRSAYSVADGGVAHGPDTDGGSGAANGTGTRGTDEDAFERAVSAAASVIMLSARQGELVRLVTTDGDDSGFGGAGELADELLDRLAAVTPRGAGSLTGAAARLARTASGRLVVATGLLGADEHGGLAARTHRYGLRVVIATRPGVEPVPGGPALVRWDGGVPFDRAWERRR
ncbi:MAG: DUF58 domain-containing protein [Microthrixaceae bacterium]